MLSDMIQYTSEISAVQPTDTTQRNYILRLINRAAQEIFDSWDLPGSNAEATFMLYTAEMQATFPWYVGEIRAVRRPQYQSKVRVVSMEPRYQHTPWRQPWFEWRIKGKIPLLQNLSQATQLTLTIPQAESEVFSVTIMGQTTSAYKDSETVTFEIGDTSKTTTKQWQTCIPFGIESISKDKVTAQDIRIYETTTGFQVSEIANRMSLAEYTLVQVHDGSQIIADTPNIEVLYKKRFVPLYYDTDSFYDVKLEDAVIWKVREHWYANDKSVENMQRAVLAQAKCKELVQQICQNQESSAQKRMQFGPNRYEYPVFLDTYLWPYSLSRPTYGV